MRNITKILLAVILMFALQSTAFAINIDDIEDLTTTITPAELANRLVGAGNVVAGSVAYTGSPGAAGTFRNGLEDGIGIDQGVILSTGDITFALGPNIDGMVGLDNSDDGDNNLNSLVSRGTTDASVLTFNFIPPGNNNRVTFRIVFASDEYSEFVGSAFNDVFAIFLNGTNAASNIARVPGTTNPITVNTLNAISTPSLFIDNADFLKPITFMPRFMTQYDGFSRVLEITGNVNPAVANSIKVAIADTDDGNVDSAVFIAQATFFTAQQFSISGTVTTAGTPLPGVAINLTGAATAAATTDASGNYTFANLANGDYTVTPSHAAFIFTPLNRAVTINNANVTGQNFVGTPAPGTFRISGTVRRGGVLGTPVPGVTITLSGAASRTAITNAIGNYTIAGLLNGNYTVTPSLAGFAFTPVSRSVAISNANVARQNFTATVTAATFSISGRVATSGGSPIAGVTMTLSGAAGGVAATDANGNYTFAGLLNGSYTVTPSQAGFTFAPTNRTVTINNANVTGQDFVGTAVVGGFSISGTVRALVSRGVPVPGVTMTLSGAASATTTTDGSGNYSFSGLGNGNYTVTPSQTGRTFTPASRDVTIINANVTGQNFTRN